MADYIVAIDLGTSHLTGIVGGKSTNGTFSIVACETVKTDNCIHRGMINNSKNLAHRISDLIEKLERSLKGDYVDKFYVGIGGQSLRSIDHIEKMDIQEGMTVTKSDIDYLHEKCRNFKPDLLDVLGMAPAVYYRDGIKVEKPDSEWCRLFEARYKLIVGRSMIRNMLKNSIEELDRKELAGIIVSPLALADAVLSPKDKELGCALVDFGAGVTSVSIFKDGDLQHLCVIPLGGRLITQDIRTLQLTEADAERLKKEKGSALFCKEDESKIIKIEMEGADHQVKLSDLNAVIEARAKEIVCNVHARICEVLEPSQLGAGIVLAGCAYELTYLSEMLKEKCDNVNVRPATIQSGLVQGSDEMLGNPLYMMAISLMLKGVESCISPRLATTTQGKNVTPVSDEEDNDETKKNEEKKMKKDKPEKEPKKPGGGWQKKIFPKSLFDEV